MALRISDEDNQKLNPSHSDYLRKFEGAKNLKNAEIGSANPLNPGADGVKNAEEGPGKDWINNVVGGVAGKSKKGIAIFKQKGAGVAIALTLIGFALVGIGGVAGPSMLLVHVKETLFDKLNDSASALEIRTSRMLFKKFKTAKNSFATYNNGKCGIDCKFGSMNDTMKRNLEAKGFKVQADEGKGLQKGRWIITEMTFPDGGKVVKDGAGFDEAMKKPANAVAFKKVFNSKTAYFLNSKFGSIIKTKFGIDKASKLVADTKERLDGKLKSAKEKVAASMRKAVGLPEIDIDAPIKSNPIDTARANPKFDNAFKTIDGIGYKYGSKATDAIGAICAVYNVSRGMTFAVKFAKVAAFATFAMMFLNAADQIKAGDADPDVISALGNQLTEVDAEGKSATDSLGYRMAAYGDSDKLPEDQQKFGIGVSNQTLGFIAGIMATVAMGGSLAIKSMGRVCALSGHFLTDLVTTCPEQIIAAAASSTFTLGIGAIASAGWCVGKMIAVTVVAGLAIGKILTGVTGAIVKNDLPVLDQDTIGKSLGNTIYNGTAQILGGTSSSYGLKAGSQTEIKQYAIDISTIKKQEDTIARYEARTTPFDIYNQYSFIGSIAQSINISAIYNSSSPLSYFGNILSVVPKSFAFITNNVGAESENKAALYADGQCTDPSLSAIGISADALCNPSYVMSGDELNANIENVVDYMVNNSYVDTDTGDPKSDSDYQQYLDNCANRTEPLGETASQIEDVDYEWKIGLKCGEQSEMLSNFRTYTMDKSINDTMDEDPSATNNTSSTTATTAGGTADPGDSSQPANTEKVGKGWRIKNGVDYSSVLCTDGTKDEGVTTHPTTKYTLRKCSTKVGVVASIISKRTLNMVNAAAADGIQLTGSGWRSSDGQIRAWNKCAPNCNGMVASPGNSNHERGLALDIDGINKAGSGPKFNWLVKNAAKYGYINYWKEGWHWSMTGG